MSTALKKDAKRLAAKGRYGDRRLLHITDEELLALLASGKITKNPETGLPEAFNLFKELQGLNERINPFAGSSNALAQLADPFSDMARDLNIGFGPMLNFNEAKKMSFSNPFSADASGWDVLAGGTAAEDPEMRRLGRTVGTMFAAGALGNMAGGAGAEAGTAGATATGAEGAALYSTPAGESAGLYGGTYSTPAMTTTAGASGTALGGSTVQTASLAGGTAAGASLYDPSGADVPVEQASADFEQGFAPEVETFNFDPMSLDVPLDSFGSGGFENNLSAELSAGAPGDPSYYDRFMDFLKSRGMKKNLMSGLQLYNSYAGMMQAKQMEKLARQADPMGPYRAQYAAELAELRRDPSRLTSTPGYKAGELAVQRSLAAQGYLGSGNARIRTADYGSQAYDREIARLSALASPSLAGSQAQMMAAQQKSKALASLAFAGAGLFV